MSVPLPVIDSSHDCESCRAQSSEFYYVDGGCLSGCGVQKFRVKVRKGDKPPLSVTCPACEVTEYSWRIRAALSHPDQLEAALARTLVSLVRSGFLLTVGSRRVKAEDVRGEPYRSVLFAILSAPDTDSALAALSSLPDSEEGT